MKTFRKLLVASAFVASFAAPAFAWDVQFEGLTLQERNVYTNPQPAPAKGWTKAYAMEAPMKWHVNAGSRWDHSGRDFTASIQ